MKTPAWTRHALWIMPLALELQPAVVAGDEQPSKTSSYSPVVINGDFTTIVERMTVNKPSVEQAHKTFLKQRYDLSDRSAEGVSMTRGEPLQEGGRVKLPVGTSREELARLSPEEIHKQGLFPGGFLPLPHPNHAEGEMVFPKSLIDEIKCQKSRSLTRLDLDHDLPDHFLPEFPASMFLTTRPDLSDVSKGKLVTIDDYFELLGGILNPEQLEGPRLLLTVLPQQQSNLTNDRRSEHPNRDVAYFGCRANDHTNAATHLVSDIRPQPFRYRTNTPTLHGMDIQQPLGSQRALKAVEDSTEFEQRTAYFDGDPVITTKKGVSVLERGDQVHFMSEFQALLDFLLAPKLDVEGRLSPGKTSEQELRGEKLFCGKAAYTGCHTPSYFADNLMHNPEMERFYDSRPVNDVMASANGLIKTFPLRGIKDSPLYLHDDHLLTLEGTVEFFNLVLERRLSAEERGDLVAYLCTL